MAGSDDAPKPADQTFTLTHDEALVLFELLSRVKAEQPLEIHGAELHVLWEIQAQLEKVLSEPFRADYEDLLAAAQHRVSHSE